MALRLFQYARPTPRINARKIRTFERNPAPNRDAPALGRVKIGTLLTDRPLLAAWIANSVPIEP
jgi:hypothetical protein